MRFEEEGEDHRAIKWRVVVLTQRKKDELQDRKEKDALKQTVLDEEHPNTCRKLFYRPICLQK